jgi:indolepyruvate ferredoxin oxidoreductase
VWHAFRLLAKLKRLRGTRLDPFGYTVERRTERHLIGEYRATILALLQALNKDNLALAAEIAALPEKIRGFGHVKEKAVAQYHAERTALLQKYGAPCADLPHAA